MLSTVIDAHYNRVVTWNIDVSGDETTSFNVFFQIPGMRWYEIRQGFVYLLAGYCCYLSGLDLAPYKGFYAMAAIGVVSFVFRIIERKKEKQSVRSLLDGTTVFRKEKQSVRCASYTRAT